MFGLLSGILPALNDYTLHQRKTEDKYWTFSFCSSTLSQFSSYFQWQKLLQKWYAISKLVGLWVRALLFSNFTFMSIRLTCGGWTLTNPIAVRAGCWAWLWVSDSIVLDVPTLGAWLWPMCPALIQGGWVLRRIKG